MQLRYFSVCRLIRLATTFLTRSIGSDNMGLRGDTVGETKATLKVVRTRFRRVLIYSKIDNATRGSLPWTQVVNFISKGTMLCKLRTSDSLVHNQVPYPRLTTIYVQHRHSRHDEDNACHPCGGVCHSGHGIANHHPCDLRVRGHEVGVLPRVLWLLSHL